MPGPHSCDEQEQIHRPHHTREPGHSGQYREGQHREGQHREAQHREAQDRERGHHIHHARDSVHPPQYSREPVNVHHLPSSDSDRKPLKSVEYSLQGGEKGIGIDNTFIWQGTPMLVC